MSVLIDGGGFDGKPYVVLIRRVRNAEGFADWMLKENVRMMAKARAALSPERN
jgi:hypothetical protein